MKTPSELLVEFYPFHYEYTSSYGSKRLAMQMLLFIRSALVRPNQGFTNYTPIARLNKVIVLSSKLQSPDASHFNDTTKLTAAKSLHLLSVIAHPSPKNYIKMSHPPNSAHRLRRNTSISFSPVAPLAIELLFRLRTISAPAVQKEKRNHPHNS